MDQLPAFPGNPAEPVMGGLLIEVFVACMSVTSFIPPSRPFTHTNLASYRLYGITTLQTFIYFQKYTNDRTFLKSLVATVWYVMNSFPPCAHALLPQSWKPVR